MIYSRFFNLDHELSDYNPEGYHFLVPNNSVDKKGLVDFINNFKIPNIWLSQGGLKLGMFSPENSFAVANHPITILRVYFKKGFKLFNRENINHMSLWKNFKSDHFKNSWEKLPELIKKLKKQIYPNHIEFYKKNGFAGFLDYSDMVMPVILISNAINKVEFVLG